MWNTHITQVFVKYLKKTKSMFSSQNNTVINNMSYADKKNWIQPQKNNVPNQKKKKLKQQNIQNYFNQQHETKNVKQQ